MNWLEFWSSIVHSIIAWPLVTLVIVLILRNSLGRVLENVSSGISELTVEAFGQKLQLNRQIQELQESADAAGLPPSSVSSNTVIPPTIESNDVAVSPVSPPDNTSRDDAQSSLPNKSDYIVPMIERNRTPSYDEVTELIAKSPDAAVLFLWTLVEEVLVFGAHIADLPNYQRLQNQPMRILALLVEKDLIDAETADIVSQMRIVRNEVAHGKKSVVSKKAADEYFKLVIRVNLALQRFWGVRGQT